MHAKKLLHSHFNFLDMGYNSGLPYSMPIRPTCTPPTLTESGQPKSRCTWTFPGRRGTSRSRTGSSACPMYRLGCQRAIIQYCSFNHGTKLQRNSFRNLPILTTKQAVLHYIVSFGSTRVCHNIDNFTRRSFSTREMYVGLSAGHTC